MSPGMAWATRPVGSHALRIEGQGGAVVGFVSGVSGGVITADVVEHQSANEPFARKQPGEPRFEDIHVEVVAAMPVGLFDWVAGSWGERPPPSRDGALLTLDHTLVVRQERPFAHALIAETSFPALDAGSKEPGRIGILITPASLQAPTHPNTPFKLSIGKAGHKFWQVSNFVLTLDGIDTKGVSRIEAFTVRRSIGWQADGSGGRNVTAGRMSFPNLRVWVSATTAGPWFAWHQDFLVYGNSTETDERAGAISLLAANAVTEVARVELHGVGILRVAEAVADDGPGSVGRVVVDLYCQQMKLLPGTP